MKKKNLQASKVKIIWIFMWEVWDPSSVKIKKTHLNSFLKLAHFRTFFEKRLNK